MTIISIRIQTLPSNHHYGQLFTIAQTPSRDRFPFQQFSTLSSGSRWMCPHSSGIWRVYSRWWMSRVGIWQGASTVVKRGYGSAWFRLVSSRVIVIVMSRSMVRIRWSVVSRVPTFIPRWHSLRVFAGISPRVFIVSYSAVLVLITTSIVMPWPRLVRWCSVAESELCAEAEWMF